MTPSQQLQPASPVSNPESVSLVAPGSSPPLEHQATQAEPQISAALSADSDSGIRVWLDGVGSQFTDNLGIATFTVDAFGTCDVCVDTTTLPPGATLKPNCQKI